MTIDKLLAEIEPVAYEYAIQDATGVTYDAGLAYPNKLAAALRAICKPLYSADQVRKLMEDAVREQREIDAKIADEWGESYIVNAIRNHPATEPKLERDPDQNLQG